MVQNQIEWLQFTHTKGSPEVVKFRFVDLFTEIKERSVKYDI